LQKRSFDKCRRCGSEEVSPGTIPTRHGSSQPPLFEYNSLTISATCVEDNIGNGVSVSSPTDVNVGGGAVRLALGICVKDIEGSVVASILQLVVKNINVITTILH
jgi:hypothetical protein